LNPSVSVKDKKKFIQWFLNHYQMKKREAVWILNYLINYPKLLAHVHFVQNTKHCRRSITISTSCSKEPAFRFHKNKLITTDADKAFHDIRINRDTDIFIQLNFKDAYQSVEYRKVLIENPYMTDDDFITAEDRHTAKALLDHSLFEYKRNKLKKEIDLALDQLDQKKFLQLSEELSRLEQQTPIQPKLQKQ
jgi:uncharacterized protein YpiB (UPF0302 family)